MGSRIFEVKLLKYLEERLGNWKQVGLILVVFVFKAQKQHDANGSVNF